MNTRERILKLVELGVMQSYIAEQNGVSRAVITRWVSEKDEYEPTLALQLKIDQWINEQIEKFKMV